MSIFTHNSFGPLRLIAGVIALVLVTSQVVETQHLHLEDHDSDSCVVCASGDLTPAVDTDLRAQNVVLPRAQLLSTTVRSVVIPTTQPFRSRAPPALS